MTLAPALQDPVSDHPQTDQTGAQFDRGERDGAGPHRAIATVMPETFKDVACPRKLRIPKGAGYDGEVLDVEFWAPSGVITKDQMLILDESGGAGRLVG